MVKVFVGLVLLAWPGVLCAQDSQDIIADIIGASIDGYSGNCPCPYNTMSNGSQCGGRSAYSKPGGKEPICFDHDVTADMIDDWRAGEYAKVLGSRGS